MHNKYDGIQSGQFVVAVGYGNQTPDLLKPNGARNHATFPTMKAAQAEADDFNKGQKEFVSAGGDRAAGRATPGVVDKVAQGSPFIDVKTPTGARIICQPR